MRCEGGERPVVGEECADAPRARSLECAGAARARADGQTRPARARALIEPPKTKRIAVMMARLWTVSHARMRSRKAAERPGANVPRAATPATEEDPRTTKSAASAAVASALASARRISPAAAITSGYVAE